MDALTRWLEKFLMPIATKVGSQKHLAAMRDGFIAMLPVSLMGAMGTMLPNVFFKADSVIGKLFNKMGWYADSIQPFMNDWLVPLTSQIWWGCLGLGVFLCCFTIAYNLAKNYGVDGLSAGLIAIATYFIMIPEVVPTSLTEGVPWGNVNWTYFNSGSVFTAIIIAIVSTEIYRIMIQKDIRIKMPEQVPPAVSKAFSAVIPAAVVMTLFSLLFLLLKKYGTTYVLDTATGTYTSFDGVTFKVLIEQTLQRPLVALGQNPIVYLFLILLSQVFWFFGLHGTNIVGPVLDTMYGIPLNQNMELVMQGQEPVNNIVRNTLDVYGMHGGSGATLGLIVAILIFSKRTEYRELAKLAFPSGAFQINEPIIFGMPIVLNPLMFIPFTLVPVICTAIGIFATTIGFAGKLYINQAWTTPAVFSAFTASGGNWGAVATAAFTFVLSIAIYIPFVVVANKQGNVSESENI